MEMASKQSGTVTCEHGLNSEILLLFNRASCPAKGLLFQKAVITIFYYGAIPGVSVRYVTLFMDWIRAVGT